MESFLEVTPSLVLLLFGLILYFLPYLQARHRGVEERYQTGIFVLNFLLGWTVLGWIGALLWAVAAPVASSEQARVCPPGGTR